LKKVIYLTFNDAPSGIYSGQVIDVCRYWKELGFDVTLVAFISIRGFSANKQKIVSAFPGAVVLPMIPRARNWKLNRFRLGLLLKKLSPAVIVGRGPFATALALYFREGKRICFDGRGAYVAELQEYNVVPDEKVKNEIAALEKRVVFEADFRLAVSEALVRYWKTQFGYTGDKHVVIPCTLNSRSVAASKSAADPLAARKRFGFSADDVVIVYSGSGAGWQSLQILDESLLPLFREDKGLKLLLLLKDIPSTFQLKTQFPERVKTSWLKPEEVIPVMSACDYGWLVRENTVTNQVASPVKFAEYLSAGLRVIISPGLGDYPQFIAEHDAGILWNGSTTKLPPVSPDEKTKLSVLAAFHFVKEIYKEQYLRLLA
jgi:hypothetical protein